MALGAIFCKLLRNCDLEVPGSPSNRTLISPLILCAFSWIIFSFPPKREKANACLTSLCPKIEGAMEL